MRYNSCGARRNRPLIKVNCAALPTGLIESELFGHEVCRSVWHPLRHWSLHKVQDCGRGILV